MADEAAAGMGEEQSYLTEEQREALEKEVNDFCNASSAKRRSHEIEWYMACRMVAGHQWIKPSKPDANQLTEDVSLPGRMEKWKITANRLLPGLDTRLAHVLKNKPIGVVLPESQDEEDRNAARIADEVVEYDFRTLDWAGKMATIAGPQQFTKGISFFHWFWDPLAGPEVTIPQYATDEAGEIAREPETVEGVDEATFQPTQVPNPKAGMPIQIGEWTGPRGEPMLEVVRAEELYLDPGANSFDDCSGVVRQTLRPIDETKRILRQAGVDEELIEKVDKASEKDASSIVANRLSGFTQTELASRCEVRVAWFKPDESKGWADGLRAVFVNRKLYIAEPTPPGSDHIPFVPVIERAVPDDIYPTSSVIQGMPLQKALNLTLSRDEYRRTVQRPKLVADYEAGVDDNAFNNDDSEVIQKNHGYTVDWIAPSSYEADPRAADRYISLLDDIFGNVAILMGESEGEIRSGRQAFIQGEYAGTALSGPARSIERAVQRIGRGLLMLRKANTNEERDVQIVGRNRDLEILHFRGSDLRGAGDYYVEPGSALPMSIAQKKQLVFEMVDRKMIAPDRALKLLPVPSDVDAEMDDQRLDRDRATEENMLFAALDEKTVIGIIDAAEKQAAMAPPPMPGAPVAPAPDPMEGVLEQLGLEPRPEFEDAQVHLDTHNRFRKTKAYRAMPKACQSLLDLHCAGHIPAMPPMPGEGPGVPGASPSGDALPQGLMPGMPPRVGNSGEQADMAGDVAGGMPVMPPTPSAAN